MRYTIALILSAMLALASCNGRTQRAGEASGDSVRFKYARQISIVRHDGYTVVTLANPWKTGKTLHRYILVPSGEEKPSDLPDGTVVRTPLRHAAVFTTVHCAMLQMLGREDCISGVADLKYIKLPWIHEQVANRHIADYGEGMSPVIEKIIDTKPDAIFLSPFENSGGYGKVEEIDIPIIECAEYMEASPLARAEWLRFYGLLVGEEQRADSLFRVVDSCYNALKSLARAAQAQPSVLVDKQVGSVWYVPGGHSTIGQMLTDAHADYPFATDGHSGSLSLPFESVLEKAGESEVWLFRYSSDHDITMRELLSEHNGYDQLRAVNEDRVYGCNVEQSLFYEESPFRPDWLLNDFIRILHPDMQGLDELRYYHRVRRK